MFEIPVEDFIFVVCALVGGGLLLITVLVDDILGAIFDFDVGGVSLMPLILSFVSMFGVGGLFATQVLDVHEGQARIAVIARRNRAGRVEWCLPKGHVEPGERVGGLEQRGAELSVRLADVGQLELIGRHYASTFLSAFFKRIGPGK